MRRVPLTQISSFRPSVSVKYAVPIRVACLQSTSQAWYQAMFDFRSDTATTPTDEMFDVMKAASKGDDVYKEDTDVNSLESYVASLCGHEDGLFCASGTMTNQLGLRSLLVQPPHSVIVDSRAHVYLWEAGGIAFHSQASVTPVVAKNGIHLTAEEISGNIFDEDVHCAPTRVIALENTLDGMIFPLSEIKKISQLARSKGIKMHLDGARVWNASIGSGVSLSEYGSHFDSMSLCLSKGIGAPIGSVLVGSRDLIKRARHFRKLFGGGWRQAGLLAATARYCIDTIWPTMARTHTLTRHLSDSFQGLGLKITYPVMTNMIHVQFDPVGLTVGDIAPRLLQERIRIAGAPDDTSLRLVLHHQITAEAVETMIRIVGEIVREKGRIVEKGKAEVEVAKGIAYPAAH